MLPLPILHHGMVRHAWSSHHAHGCYMVNQLAAPGFKPATCIFRVPCIIIFGHHISLTKDTYMQHPNNYIAVPLGTDRKRTGWLEDSFMKTMPAENDRMIKSYTTDSKAYMASSNTSDSNGGKVSMLLPSSRASELMSGILHVMTNQTASLIKFRSANITRKSSSSPVKGKKRTRSGQISCRLIKSGINPWYAEIWPTSCNALI